MTTVILPRLLRGNDSFTSFILTDSPEEMDVDKAADSEAERPPPVTSVSPSVVHLAYSESAMTSKDAAEAVRCIAWLLARTLTVPGLPCPRPLKAPAPLIVRSTEDGEQSDSEEDEDDSSASVGKQAGTGIQSMTARSIPVVSRNSAAYVPTWVRLGIRTISKWVPP